MRASGSRVQRSGLSAGSRRRFDTYERALLNFLHRLLEGRLMAPVESRKPEYWRETVDIIGEMYARAILSFLVYEGGWQRRRFVSGERIQDGRIWDCPDFSSMQPDLGEASIKLTVELFEALSRAGEARSDPCPAKIRACIKKMLPRESPAESLLVYLVARPLATSASYPELMKELARRNGRVQLGVAASPAFPVGVDQAALRAFFEQWGWTMPWLADELAGWWVGVDKTRYSGGLTHYQRVVEALTVRLKAVLEAAEAAGRPDWTLPVQAFLRRAYGGSRSPEEQTEGLEYMIGSESHQMRQLYRDEWGALLRTGSTLGAIRRRLRATHPADREAPEKLFLALWEEDDFDSVLARVERLRTHLERVV